MAPKNDLNLGLIATIVLCSAFLLLDILVGIHAAFLCQQQREIQSKWEEYPNTQLQQAQNDQIANISHYGWIDRDKKICAIPVEVATKIIIANKGKVKFGTQQ
jgi:hypothetical protein